MVFILPMDSVATFKANRGFFFSAYRKVRKFGAWKSKCFERWWNRVWVRVKTLCVVSLFIANVVHHYTSVFQRLDSTFTRRVIIISIGHLVFSTEYLLRPLFVLAKLERWNVIMAHVLKKVKPSSNFRQYMVTRGSISLLFFLREDYVSILIMWSHQTCCALLRVLA